MDTRVHWCWNMYYYGKYVFVRRTPHRRTRGPTQTAGTRPRAPDSIGEPLGVRSGAARGFDHVVAFACDVSTVVSRSSTQSSTVYVASVVRSVEGAGQWLTESYQLYDGTYLGTRHHVRAYRSPSDPWTAMQAHREYWDWFRLRHTVTSIRDTQQYVDAQFLDDRRVEGVYRVHLDNGASQDGDGWATVIEFAAVVGLLLGVGRDWRLDRLLDRSRTWLASDDAGSVVRVGVLVVAMAGVYLAVRVGGVALERQFGGVSPKLIAAALYPVLALGLPVAAYVLSRDLEAEDAFAGAVVGLVAGFVVEYGYLGLEVIPVSLLLHRVALVLALGLIAAAGALSSLAVAGWTRLLGLGVAGWVVALGLPLLGVV